MKLIWVCLSVCVLLTALATWVFGQSHVKWGRAQNNLQLGIGLRARSSESAPALRVSLKNVGSEIRELSIGFEGSAGPVYNVKITAMSDQQPGEQLVYDLNALKAHPTTGFVVAKTVSLEPGAAYVFTFPTKQLICIVDREDVPLEDLLKRGYSVRASFEIAGLELVTPELAVQER